MRSRSWLRFDRSPLRPAYRFQVTIGLGRRRDTQRCIGFEDLPELVRLPLVLDGVAIESTAGRVAVMRSGPLEPPALVVDQPLVIALPEPAVMVEIDLPADAGMPTIEALNETGDRLAVRPEVTKQPGGGAPAAPRRTRHDTAAVVRTGWAATDHPLLLRHRRR